MLSRDPLEPSAPWACQVTIENMRERDRGRGMAGSVPPVMAEEGKVRVLFETYNEES